MERGGVTIKDASIPMVLSAAVTPSFPMAFVNQTTDLSTSEIPALATSAPHVASVCIFIRLFIGFLCGFSTSLSLRIVCSSARAGAAPHTDAAQGAKTARHDQHQGFLDAQVQLMRPGSLAC
jgi:hypothetical protein